MLKKLWNSYHSLKEPSSEKVFKPYTEQTISSAYRVFILWSMQR